MSPPTQASAGRGRRRGPPQPTAERRPARVARIRDGLAVATFVVLIGGLAASGAVLPTAMHIYAISCLAVTAAWLILDGFTDPAARERVPAGDEASSVLVPVAPRPGAMAWLGHVAVCPETWLLSLAAYAGVSTVWSIDPRASLWAAGVLLGGWAFLRAGAWAATRRWRGSDLLTVGLTVLGAVVSLAALVGFATGDPQWREEIGGTLLALGPFGYANALGSCIVLVLPAPIALMVGRWTMPRGRSVAVVAAAVVLAEVATLVLTRSKGAVVGLAVAGGLAAALRVPGLPAAGGRRRWPAIAGLVAVVGLAVAGALLWSHLPAPGALVDQHRRLTWEAAATTARERPVLGWGAGTFFPAYNPNRLTSSTRYAHDIVLQYGVELGAVGVALLAGLMVTLLAIPFWRLRRARLTEAAPWLWMGPAALVVHNLVDISWFFPALFSLTLVIGGGVVQAARRDESR